MPGDPRVRTEVSPVSYPELRTSKPDDTEKMAYFRRKIPITYPQGKHVLSPPTNLSIFPAPTPSKNPKKYQAQLFHVRDKGGNKLSPEKLLQDPISSKIWFPSTENKLGRYSQGFKERVKAQDAMDFIHKHEVPPHKTVTYANFVCDYRPLKSKPFRVRMTVGGDKLSNDEDTGSPTASILETKLLANSVISDHKKHNSRFCAINLKDFFLNTPMEKPEYIRIHKKYFSPAFLTTIANDNHIYCQVKKGMYGIKQTAILAYKLLV